MFHKFKGKIIWSADGISFEELIAIIEDDFPKDSVAIKLDRLFLTRYGLGTISEVQKRGIPVFADAKIVEIPSKVNEVAKLHLEHQPWMLNVMAGVCNNGLTPSRPNSNQKADELYHFSGLCREAGTKSCVVTVLTSKTPELAEDEFNKTALEAVMFYAQLAFDCGVTDIVCSPEEAIKVRTLGSIDINTPGIRMPGGDAGDQARIMTPANAIKNGATRLVIGRPLSEGGDFHGNLAKIRANMGGAT
ncbi:orotidine 5'-phosphate decarboxylase [Candidatus Saccharibacteria bacterium]|nr:orotidine 5'-phosphate decarboxylase [Candidatus Saccharibacteria bacterium]